jgi:hypothetical protein
MLSGEMIVMGTKEAHIELTSKPIRLNVEFSDTGIIIPCDPSPDILEFSVQNNILTIRWQVSGIREIQYKAWFYWSEIN